MRRIEIRTRRAVKDGLAGHYHSVFKGRGMAFSEVRPYQPGDEIRTIDWNVTARTQAPHVKVFTEERELTVVLLVDLSASGDFGTAEKAKAEVAAEIAGLLAYSAISNGDRVGLLLFTDRIERFIPPAKGRRHVLRVIGEVLAHRPEGRGTDIDGALAYHRRLMRRSTVTFLLSDLLADGLERPLTQTARRHDLVPVVLSDPFEETLPDLGLVAGEDAETGEPILLDTASPRVRRRWVEGARARRAERDRMLRRAGLDHVEVRTDRDYVAPLASFFSGRSRRRLR